MKTWVRRTTRIGILSAGFLLASAAAAHASDQVSAANNGIASGTQANAPITVPVNVSGNGVGVAGIGIGGNSSGAMATANMGAEGASVGNRGIADGTQVNAPVTVVVNVCGNGVGVLGIGVGGDCSMGDGGTGGGGGGYGTFGAEAKHVTEAAEGASVGNRGIADGTQVNAPVTVPVNVCGNGVGVLGIGVGGDCSMGNGGGGGGYGTFGAEAKHAKAGNGSKHAKAGKHAKAVAHNSAGKSNQISAGNTGAINGTQVNAPVKIPVNVTGNGVGVLGVGIG